MRYQRPRGVVGRTAKMNCEKCGQTISGGRRRLNRHKREHHSY